MHHLNCSAAMGPHSQTTNRPPHPSCVGAGGDATASADLYPDKQFSPLEYLSSTMRLAVWFVVYV